MHGRDIAPGANRSDVRVGRSPLWQPRWRGQRGRLEVWYTTLTDPRTGLGLWLHHELVAPVGDSPPFAHGWASVFPPGAPPMFARFGPTSWHPPADAEKDSVFTTQTTSFSPQRLRGRAGDISWDLSATGDDREPLFTFPRWAWEREVLPAAQIVPAPTDVFSGCLRWGGEELTLKGAPGASAHIYGHRNARRWAWLHADLGGGDVAEVVAAVPTAPGLRRLAPLPFLRLRLNGREWPASPWLSALALRARIDLPTWTVAGRIGGRAIEIRVTQPPEATVAVDYTDPDGATAICHNSECADAVITLHRARGLPQRWHLAGTAHAEVGMRP